MPTSAAIITAHADDASWPEAGETREMGRFEMPGKTKSKPSRETWFVYMLRCADGTLYTGITNDLSRRCQQHNAGKASRYTRSRLPTELIHDEKCSSRSQALKREAAIKALPRRQKQALIGS